MKKTLFIFLSFIVVACSDEVDSDFSDSIYNEYGEMIVDEPQEDVIYEWETGNLESRDDMKILLSEIGVAKFTSEGADVVGPYLDAIIQDEDSNFVQACDYEGRGNYTFEIGNGTDEELFDGVPYPVIGHDYDEPNYFIIEDIFVSEKGKNAMLTVRRLSEEDGQYFIDMSTETNIISVYRDMNNRLIMKDGDGKYGYYSLEEDVPRFPKQLCDETH